MEKRWGKPAQELPIDHPAWALEAHYLALGLANWICTLSPKRMVLGGGVMQQQWLFPLIRAEFIRLLNGYVRSKELIENVDRRHSDLRPISTHLPESVIIGCVATIPVCEKCVFSVFLANQRGNLWLAKLARSSHEATADDLAVFISAAITKPTSANITPEQFAVQSGKRKRI